MEWLADPTAWLGLLTLIVLELVLGIDNLVFIAILADKLPPEQRDRARLIGLSLALLMRLGLLASISWLVTLTQPLFEVFDKSFSGRDLIMLFGGVFLLFKATMELHERLEGHVAQRSGNVAYAPFSRAAFHRAQPRCLIDRVAGRHFPRSGRGCGGDGFAHDFARHHRHCHRIHGDAAAGCLCVPGHRPAIAPGRQPRTQSHSVDRARRGSELGHDAGRVRSSRSRGHAGAVRSRHQHRCGNGN